MFTRHPIAYPDKVAVAHDIAKQVATDAQYSLAFVCGSPFAGLGTPQSDIDLFVVLDGGKAGPAAQVLVDLNRVDLNKVSLEWLTDAVTLCETFTHYEEAEADANVIRLDGLEKLVRFALADLICDDGRLADLQQRLVAATPQLMRLLVLRYALRVSNNLEDIQGFLAIGEWRSAGLVAHNAMLSAAAAYLASRGDIYMGYKWVPQQWRRTVGDKRELLLSDRAQDVDEVVRQAWLIQELVLSAILGDQYNTDSTAEGGDITRDFRAGAMPVHDAVMVYRSGRPAVRLSRQGALLWTLAHGRTRQAAVALTVERLADSGLHVGASDVDSYYQMLVRVGLLIGVPTDLDVDR